MGSPGLVFVSRDLSVSMLGALMQKATARICVVLLACLFVSPSLAAEGPWSTKEHSKIRVVALGPSPEDPEAYILGIHILFWV